MKILSVKQILVIIVFMFGVIYSMPTFLNEVPSWLTSINAKKMNLGLDLKGGVHFLMEVDLNEVSKSKSKKLSNDIRSELRKEKIRYNNFNYSGKVIEINFIDVISYDKAKKLVEESYQNTFEIQK
jgi:preprotein translocase subunit SecD